MEDKFIIEIRYEYNSVNGKVFTNWFPMNTSMQFSENEGKAFIKEYKKDFEYIDRKTKLKHEYRLKSYNEYLDECKKRDKEVKILKKKQEEYYKSDAYKELQKKKRQSNKELKEHQKQYIKEHEKLGM